LRARLIILTLCTLAAGCSGTTRGPDQGGALTLGGALHDPPKPALAETSGPLLSAADAPAVPKVKLLCDAPSLVYLIGHPRTQIPVPADLSKRRVTCTSCPASEDHRPDRTDILFDARTGLVTDVTCG
jgi:hypothetical protein